jgi:hypothetical protein
VTDGSVRTASVVARNNVKAASALWESEIEPKGSLIYEEDALPYVRTRSVVKG